MLLAILGKTDGGGLVDSAGVDLEDTVLGVGAGDDEFAEAEVGAPAEDVVAADGLAAPEGVVR